MESDYTKYLTVELNENVLLEVFEFLDGRSLKNSALVCSKWNEIIGSASRTMKKFRLKIGDESDLGENEKLERKHYGVVVDVDSEQKLLNLIERCDVTNVRSFQHNNRIFAVPTFHQILSQMPLLEDVLIKTNGEIVAEIEKLELLELKHLKIHLKDFEVLDFIAAKKLESLTLLQYFCDIDCDKSVLNFLKTLSNLHSFTFDSKVFSQIFRKKSKFTFQLKTLKIIISSPKLQALRGHQNEAQNFENFMLENCQRLTQLILISNKLSGISEEFLAIILQIPNLTDLQLEPELLPSKREAFGRIKPLGTLKSLTFFRSKNFSSSEAAEEFFQLCPEIENLDLSMNIGPELEHVSKYNQKLMSVNIGNLKSFPRNLKSFENLKSLTIVESKELKDVKSFVAKCPQLENLNIQNINQSEKLELLFDIANNHPSKKLQASKFFKVMN